MKIISGGGVRVELKDFQPVHDRCSKGVREGEKCDKIYDDKELGYERCSAYLSPSHWWDHVGNCPLASHMTDLSAKEKAKVRVGQQKQKKWYGRK